MQENRKIISLGDYITKKNKIVDFELNDPESDGMVTISFLIKRPTPYDTIKVMEHGAANQDLFERDQKDMSEEELNRLYTAVFNHDAIIISSCVFFPPENGEEPKKVFETPKDVLERCPNELFTKLKDYIQENGFIIASGEAKK